MNRKFVFSDVHGCFSELQALIKTITKEANFNPEKDQLIMLGDMIDRGLQVKELLNWAIKSQKKYPHWVFLYGNHEDLMLDTLEYGERIYHSFDLWWRQGGMQTAHSYYPKNATQYEKSIMSAKQMINKKHIEWLKNLPFYYEDEKYFYVHGGVVPGTTLKQQTRMLQKGNPEEQEAIRNAFLWARDTFIDSPYKWEKKIIFGHTADYVGKWHPEKLRFQPIVMDNKIGIDTACCAPRNNGLTCVELPSEKFYFQHSYAGLEFMKRVFDL